MVAIIVLVMLPMRTVLPGSIGRLRSRSLMPLARIH